MTEREQLSVPPPLLIHQRVADDGFGGGAGAGLGKVDWGRHELVAFEKNFYMEHPAVSAMTKEEVLLHEQMNVLPLRADSGFWITHHIASVCTDAV